jgi:hypothetical protein
MPVRPEPRFCRCCEPPSPGTPAEVLNRPGLPAVAFRVGTFDTFRQAILQRISAEAALGALTTRESDDYAVTLAELFAVVGDVLTFYNERIANERFLRTARERDSILRLVRLIGYRLRPGLAATAMLAFGLDEGATTRIRRGLKVMSIPGQDERPQTFETLEELVARGELNALPVYPVPLPLNPFQRGRRTAPLLSRPAVLAAGQRLALFDAETLEEKVVESIRAARDGEHLDFTPGVQASSLRATVARLAKIERRLRFFGHAAPQSYQAYDTNPGTPPARRWITVNAFDAGYDLGFPATASTYPLDGRDDALKPGARLLVDAGPGADPRFRTAVVAATHEAPTALGQVPDTAPHLQETVTHATLLQTTRGRVITALDPAGIVAVTRSGGGRVVAYSPGTPRWEPVDRMIAADDLCAAAPGAATLHLIARGADDVLRLNVRAGGAWGAWTSLGGTTTARPAALALDGGEVLVFARGPLFGLRLRSIADPTWVALGGVMTSAPAPVSWGGSRVDLFARGPDRALWRIARSAGAWQEWERLGGTLAGAPAAASTGPNRLDVVAIDDAGALIHRRWDGTRWSEWRNLGGRSRGEPALAAAAPDRLDVFVRGEDDQLWQITRNGPTWSPWTARGGALGDSPSLLRSGALMLVTAPDTDGVPVATWGNGVAFVPVVRVASGLGEIPDRRRTRIFELAAPEALVRQYDYPRRLAGGRLAARLSDAPAIAPLEKERRILIEAGDRRHLATVTASALVAASPGGPPDHLLVDFVPPLADPIEAAVLRGNVAKASHGETQPDEPLGNGDATRAFAAYRLRRSPLTYLQSAARMDGEAALEVRVNGQLWTEAPSLYGRGAAERLYIARQDDVGETQVTFGDGRTGARVPTGAGNIVARYRTGSGLAGRVRAGQLAIPLERPVGLKSVVNPLAADGGADPESRDGARDAAPTTVRTFGRAVSLEDFAWLATTSGLVARATATWVWRSLEKCVHLTVAGADGVRLSADTLKTLFDALTASRDPNRILLLANLVRVPVVVRAKVVRDPSYTADDVHARARQALLDSLSFPRMPLGAAVHASDIFAAIHAAAGVVAVDLDVFHLKGHASLTAAERAVRDVGPGPVQDRIRIFPARPTPADPALIDRYARAGFTGPVPPPVLAAEQAFVEDAGADVTLTVVEAL